MKEEKPLSFGILDFCHPLFPEAFVAASVVVEAKCGFAYNGGRGFNASLLPLEIALQGIQEESVVGDGIPRSY